MSWKRNSVERIALLFVVATLVGFGVTETLKSPPGEVTKPAAKPKPSHPYAAYAGCRSRVAFLGKYNDGPYNEDCKCFGVDAVMRMRVVPQQSGTVVLCIAPWDSAEKLLGKVSP